MCEHYFTEKLKPPLRFVQENGGNFNGATWESATTYIFKIRNEYWVQTAKILASFVGNFQKHT